MALFGVCPRSVGRIVRSPILFPAPQASSASASRLYSTLLRHPRLAQSSRSAPSSSPTAFASSRRSLSLFPSSSSSPVSDPLPTSAIDDSLLAASAKTTPATPPPSISDPISASGSASASPASFPITSSSSATSAATSTPPNFPVSDSSLTSPPSGSAGAIQTDFDPSATGIDLNELAHIPMMFGDLKAMGLCSWWPTGIMERIFEIVHVGTGLPWWLTIIATTILVRAALLKLFISQAGMAGKSLLIQPETLLIQADMAKAKANKDQTALAHATNRLMALNKRVGINPLTMIGGVLITLPATLATFFALRKMALLPVPGFLVGGIPGWCEDLTAIDPTYILPVTSCLATWSLAHIGHHGARPSTQGNNAIAMSFAAKCGSIVALPAISGFTLPAAIPLIGGAGFSGFPAAVLLYWTTTNTLAFLQSYLIQFPSIRSYLALPPVPQHTRPVGEVAPTGYQAARMWWSSKMEDGRNRQLEKEREHLDRQRKAGVVARKKVLDIEGLGRSMSLEQGGGKQEGSQVDASVADVISAAVASVDFAPSSTRTTTPTSSFTSSTTAAAQRPCPSSPSQPPPSAILSKIDTLRSKRLALARQIAETEAKVAAASAAAKEAKRLRREEIRRG